MLHPLDVILRGDPRSERADYKLRPQCDIIQVGDKQIAYVELAGCDKSDISLTLADNEMTIHGQVRKPETYTSQDASFRVAERHFGQFTRSIQVGAGVAESDVTAKFDNGVLVVEMPKIGKNAEARKIPVS